MGARFDQQPRRQTVLTLCLILGLCGGVRGMWLGGPGEGWMRNRAIWQRPAEAEAAGEEAAPADGEAGGHGARYAVAGGTWSDEGEEGAEEEEDDKRDGQLSSQSLINLIRGNGRWSTIKRSATCGPSEFHCVGSGSCIGQELVCNGQEDCPMGTDEVGCKMAASRVSSQPSGSGLSHHVARNTKHEPKKPNDCLQRLINGLRIAGPSGRRYTCPVGYAKCATLRMCFDERYACDGYVDCLDASDELGCAGAQCPAAGYIKCDNQWQCFDKTRTCDGQVDCNDGSDERHCG